MKVLSLDIGSSSIKAVELDFSFGRFELSDYFIEKVQAEPEKTTVEPGIEQRVLSAGQAQAIREIINSHPLRYERLVVNFPKGLVTTKIFNFPTKERKVIQSSLGFELEDEIPFSLEKAIYDFAIVNSESGGSSVFTAVALRADLSQLVSELQMLGLDPDMITVDPWALGQLLKRSIPSEYEGRPVCVLDIGSRQAFIHLFVENSPLITHVCSVGGIDITKSIAMAYGIGFDDAESAKVDGAFLVTQTHLDQGIPITDEQKQFSSVIAEAIFPITREIKQTLMAFKSQYKLMPKALFITGGSTLIPNLPLFLEEEFLIPVFPMTYISKLVGQTLQLSESSESRIATATALGLAAVKSDRNSTINLRKEEFAKAGGLGGLNLKAFAKPLKYLAAALAFVYVNLFLQWLVLSSRTTGQQVRYERAIKSVVGAVSQSVMNTYLNSPSALKSAVTKELAKYKETAPVTVKTQASALDILNKMSAAIPRDMVLDVNVFEIKEGKFKMTGVVDHMTSADRIAKALEESKLVTDLTKNKPEEDPKTKKVKFEFSAKVADSKAAEAPSVKTR